jgi:ribonuclease HI
MSVPAPHFLLYSQAAQPSGNDSRIGHWKFVLRQPGSEESLEAADEEPETSPERLELLAVIRGLEALGERSRVTLVAPSRYIQRGLEFGLTQWRENDWQWERYGRMTPVKNSDLWQRLARLVEIHTVQCRPGRMNQADDLAAPPVSQPNRTLGGKRLRFDRSRIEEPKNRRTKEPKVKNRLAPASLGSLVLRFFGFLIGKVPHHQ